MAYRKTPKPAPYDDTFKKLSEKIAPIEADAEGPRGLLVPPSHAATIWMDGEGNFRLGIPGTKHSSGFTIKIAPTPAGLTQLSKLLKERAMARETPTIGLPGAPTQAILDAWATSEAKANAEDQTRFRKLSPEDMLKELGL